MVNTIGIRREDKYRWERRAPLTPVHVARLVRDYGLKIYVQPPALRVFPDEAYREAGAKIQEDLSPCSVLGRLFHFIKAEASNDVIVYHANCLHEGIANSRPNEVEAPLLQVFAYRVGQFVTGRQFG